ncbi:MAG: hypothetical protein QJR03_13425 [Sphaerobacter sp.]|nr:hypothetical protein [Sphaerobacter sp.]
MQTAEVASNPQFAGTDDEQRMAAEIFQALRAMGRLFPRSAPIRGPLAALAEYYAARHTERSAEEWSAEIDRVLSMNPAVFHREESDDRVVFSTTAEGRAPTFEPEVDEAHMLKRRFQEPVPLPEQPAAFEPRRRPEVVADEVPGEPVGAVTAEAEPAAEQEPAAVAPEPTAEQEPAAVAPEPEVVSVAAEALSDEALAALDDAALADLIRRELRQDLSVANFGDLWMAEEKVPRLSRGELRRIREYLLERGEPLADDTLAQDALGASPSASDYELTRFALNFRLLREHREFEFVGTPDQRLWTTTGLPTIGTTKRKASEIGSDYRFLLDYAGQVVERAEPVAEHVLTFYEYNLGVLPYDATFASLFPPPMVPDQRAAVLVFESPQTFETFLVELRYPTANRGGYLAGFERFFSENLVPGALITIERNGNSGRYLIEYLPVSGEDRKLLYLDEKKGRYVFRPTTFYCATQENMLLTENRFPRLANQAPLEERIRRRPEEVLAVTFERIGEADGGRYMAMLDDLLAVANIERPMTAELIRDIVRSPEHPQFTEDPDVEDVFYYQPSTTD